MEKLIPKLYKEFGNYTNKEKMIPNLYDGCIPVWRRILLGTHFMAKNDFKKTAAVLGYVMLRWHPHAEASGPAETLVKNNFLIGQGQWGNRIGTEETGAAATRYTELKSNPLIEEIAFKYIDNVPWEEKEAEKEPLFLSTMIPLCLFSKYSMSWMGFGFMTSIPNYKLKDLIKRLLWLQDPENRKKPTIKPSIEECKVTSKKEELENLLTTGNGKIDIEGTVHKDPKNFRIYLRGWNPNSTFISIFKKIERDKSLNEGDFIHLDESTEEEGFDWKGTNIKFQVNKSRNREEIYKKLEKAIDKAIRTSISYKIYAYDPNKDKIVEPSVDKMLLQTFKLYKNILKNFFQKKIKDTKNEIEEMKAIELIKKHIGKTLSLNEQDKIINELHKKTKLDVETIKRIVDKYKIKKLLTVNTDINDLKNKLNDYQKDLDNIDEYTINCYENLLKEL
jgi:DNA gyrase/topoisomerase IV subunit A